MEREHWITALDRSFQRILRWIYPGILFFILLYISDNEAISNISDKIGFLENIIWILLIGSFGIGSIIYLVEQYVINVLIAVLVNLFTRIKVLRNSGNKVGEFLFLEDAKTTKRRYKSEEKLSDYMDYAWGAYHALAVTGYLIFVFEFKDASNLFSKITILPTVIASTLIFFALLLNARLRVYRKHFFSNEPQNGCEVR